MEAIAFLICVLANIGFIFFMILIAILCTKKKQL